ncbi:hypothetical protein LU293_04890 [Moraxella nasovis]|uniref:hypothetical protein n=1 Tax=Moraxella nasovis TaxID=2904121 RepID=UPI001F603F96|nr:hypothetical protein [Moraxella nasovis]UNU74233.1 hypothetical protein LU293_04890 [Moraxella nasovis]
MNVVFSHHFKKQFSTLNDQARQAILDFIKHARQHGLKGLQGRNKSSIPPTVRTKRQRDDFAFAQKYCLWHYHIGVPYYVGNDGDKTSEMILHYQRLDDEIRLLAIGSPTF